MVIGSVFILCVSRIIEQFQKFLPIGGLAITNIIRHELLVGASRKKDFQQLKQLLFPLNCYSIPEEEFETFD